MGLFTKLTPQEKELKQLQKQEKRREKELHIAEVSADALTSAEHKLAREEQHLAFEQRENPSKLEGKKLEAAESLHNTVAHQAEKAREKVADLEEKVNLTHVLVEEEERAAAVAKGGPVNFDSVSKHHTQHDHNTCGCPGKGNTANHPGGGGKGLGGGTAVLGDHTHTPVSYQEPLATSGRHQNEPTADNSTTAGTTQHNPTVHYDGVTNRRATGTAGRSKFTEGAPTAGTHSRSTADQPRMVPRHAYQGEDTAGYPLTDGVQVHVSSEVPHHPAGATEQQQKRYHVGNFL